MRSLPAADSTTFLSNASHLRSYNSPAASSSPATLHPRRPPPKPLFPLAALVITDEASPFALRSARSSFRGQQCTTGALLAPRGREGAAGGGRHRQVVGGAGGVLHPRAGHRPRAVPVRPRGVPRPLVRRRRRQPGRG